MGVASGFICGYGGVFLICGVFAACKTAFMIFVNLRLPKWRIFKMRPKQFYSSSLTLDALAQRKTGPSFCAYVQSK